MNEEIREQQLEGETKEGVDTTKISGEAGPDRASEAETAAASKPVETMADYAEELEASYKEYDQRQSQTYVAEETPDAEEWQELRQMQADKTVVKVKIKEIVKGGAIAYVNDRKAFIPASQLSLEYVEKLEDWVGRYIETYIITVDPEKKRLVLSAKELLKERREAEKKERMAAFKTGDIVEGTVDSLKAYGAFVKLAEGVDGLLHISQISSQRIKHPGVVLKEGQKIKVKILSAEGGKLSLSMKGLEPKEAEESVHFEYKNSGQVSTSMADLLKNIKL